MTEHNETTQNKPSNSTREKAKILEKQIKELDRFNDEDDEG